MLKVQSLAGRRGGRFVFREVGFQVDRGGLLLVTGANGSGKSSLLRVLAGLHPAAKGEIFWQSQPVIINDYEHRRRLQYIGHLGALKPALTPLEMLDYWRALRPSSVPHRPDLPLFGLMAHATKPIRYLSAGQRQRLTLMRLLLDDAPLWILDEPTTTLDQEGHVLLSHLIKQHRAEGGVAIIATHPCETFTDAQQCELKEKGA